MEFGVGVWCLIASNRSLHTYSHNPSDQRPEALDHWDGDSVRGLCYIQKQLLVVGQLLVFIDRSQ